MQVTFFVKIEHCLTFGWNLPDITESCAARCLKRQISCHKNRYICHNCTLYRQRSNTLRILKLVRYYAVIKSRCGKLPCKHGGKRCLLLWQKRHNSSKISMDHLIKVDEKTSVSNIIHASYIRSKETRMLCKILASEKFDGTRNWVKHTRSLSRKWQRVSIKVELQDPVTFPLIEKSVISLSAKDAALVRW